MTSTICRVRAFMTHPNVAESTFPFPLMFGPIPLIPFWVSKREPVKQKLVKRGHQPVGGDQFRTFRSPKNHKTATSIRLSHRNRNSKRWEFPSGFPSNANQKVVLTILRIPLLVWPFTPCPESAGVRVASWGCLKHAKAMSDFQRVFLGPGHWLVFVHSRGLRQLDELFLCTAVHNPCNWLGFARAVFQRGGAERGQ